MSHQEREAIENILEDFLSLSQVTPQGKNDKKKGLFSSSLNDSDLSGFSFEGALAQSRKLN